MPLNTTKKLDQPFTPNLHVTDTTASAVALLWLVLESKDLVTAHRREVMKVAIWKHTEAAAAPPGAKYRLRYRTRAAMDLTTATVEEHQRSGKHTGREGWGRYAAAGIAVWDCQEDVAFVLPDRSTD